MLSSTVLAAFGQQLSAEEQGCIVVQVKERAYAPFRIIMQGDPATRNSIEDFHSDTASRWHMDRAEFSSGDSPTTVNFFTESVDDWKWVVRSEYKIEAVEPRPVTVSFQADNVEFMSQTFYRTGHDFCIVFFVAVREAPHIFTEEEILETADKIQEENFEVVGSQINALVREVTATKNSNNVVNAIAVILVLVLIMTNALQSRGNKQLKRGMNQERQLLSGERSRTMLQMKQNKIDNDKWRGDAQSKFQNLVNFIEVEMRQIVFDHKPVEAPESLGPHKPEPVEETVEEALEIAKKDLEVITDVNEYRECEEHIAELEKIIEDNKEAENQFTDFGKADPLHLEESKADPKSFDLLHHAVTIKDKLTEIITKGDSDKDVEKNQAYYEKYYTEKLSGHTELIEEYELQCDAYKQTASSDSYLRTQALAILSNSNKKFDPREEIE